MVDYATIKQDVVLCNLLGETSRYDTFCKLVLDCFEPSLLIVNTSVYSDQYTIIYSVYHNNYISISAYTLAKWMAQLSMSMNDLCTIIGDYLYEITGKVWKIS